MSERRSEQQEAGTSKGEMTFFRAEYSAEGMDPHPKKVQEIVEIHC